MQTVETRVLSNSAGFFVPVQGTGTRRTRGAERLPVTALIEVTQQQILRDTQAANEGRQEVRSAGLRLRLIAGFSQSVSENQGFRRDTQAANGGRL